MARLLAGHGLRARGMVLPGHGLRGGVDLSATALAAVQATDAPFYLSTSLDPADGNVWQDTSRETPAGVGDAVASWRWVAPGGDVYAEQATEARRPVLRQDGSRFYLEYSGGQVLVLPSLDLTGRTTATLTCAMRTDDNTALQVGMMHGTSLIGERNLWLGVRVVNHVLWGAVCRIDGFSARATSTDMTVPAEAAVTGTYDATGLDIALRLDGVEESTSTGGTTFVELQDAPVHVGARDASGGAGLTGRIYGGAIVGAEMAGAGLDAVEALMQARRGA